MKNIEIVSKVVSREGEALVSPSKGVSMGNLSDYLLKSIWDKVFELRTDSQGTEYIFGKLPMVTQYGITMYSGDGVDVPSLASGLPFDGRTIWYNPDTQQIEVIGGGSGGGGTADSVAWANITGKPTWIGSSKPIYSYSEITGAISTTELQNYLTSNSYLNVTSGDNRYLKLSGGTINVSLGNPYIGYANSGANLGRIGVTTSFEPFFYSSYTGANNTIWHSGNDGSGSGLDADLLDGKHADSFMNFNANTTYVGASMGNDNLSKLASGNGHIEFWDSAGGWFNGKWGKLIAVSGFEGSLSGNASSATKLQTARTIWGQSFDGTGNVSGALSDVTGITFKNDYYGLVIDEFGNFSFKKPYSTTAVDWSFKDSSGNKLMIVNNYGSVGIGTPNPNAKLHIVNNTNTSTGIRLDGGWSGYGFLYNGINIFLNGEHYGGIGVNTVSSASGSTATAGTYITNAKSGEYMNFYNEGGVFLKANLLVNGGITMYSQRSLKNVVDERGLSLNELSTIKPTRYTWKDSRDNRLHFGGIADDIQQVLPEVVYKTSDGILTMDYGNAAFAVASSLIKPVVDHEKRIAMLEEENKELRNEIERLKAS